MNNAEKILKSRFENKKVILLGAGVSNRPLAKMLSEMGANVEIRDKKSREELGDIVSVFEELGASMILGEEYLDDLAGDFIIRSPGFRPDMPALLEAKKSGAEIVSEMELFVEVTPSFTIGVTGSDGKSTTTTLISKILEKALGEERVYLGGNIGFPLLNRVGEMDEKTVVAAELSSFQLFSISSCVDVAVITNITPNHLNWHVDMEEYIEAKARILNGVKYAVINYDNETTRLLASRCSCPVVYFSRTITDTSSLPEKDSLICLDAGEIVRCKGEQRNVIMKAEDILLPGLHNVENYMAAIAATEAFATPDDAREVARTFGGVKHRLELIRQHGGVFYYNSSIDSSPTRTAAAISAITDKPINIICGGYDKNLPFAPLADALAKCKNLKSVTLTGATAQKIFDAISECPDFDKNVCVEIALDFKDAVTRASAKAVKGDCVLLSPACASFDAFENFEVRGDCFRKIVNEL